MARHRVWNFRNPRLSIAQSGIRAVISHSLKSTNGAALMQSRLAAWSMGAMRSHVDAMPRVGVCAEEPTMKAVGTVLAQVDQGKITNADQACTAYLAVRSAVPKQLPAATGAGITATGLARDCMDLVAQYLLAWVFDNQSRENLIASQFRNSQCDPGWLTALKAWLLFYWGGKPPVYKPPTTATVPIALPPGAGDGSLRVGVLGDWGTGEPDAIAVLDQLMQLKPDVIVHLGDIYYAGTIDECRTNFLAPIQTARAKYTQQHPGLHDSRESRLLQRWGGFLCHDPAAQPGRPERDDPGVQLLLSSERELAARVHGHRL